MKKNWILIFLPMIHNWQAAIKASIPFIYLINCVFNTPFLPPFPIVTRFHVQFRNPPLKCETRIDWQIYPLILPPLPFYRKLENRIYRKLMRSYNSPLPPSPYFKRGSRNNRIAARIHFYKYKYARARAHTHGRVLLFSALNNYRERGEGGGRGGVRRACK